VGNPASGAQQAGLSVLVRCGSELRIVESAASTDRQLAVYFKQKYRRAARWEGASTGTAGLLGLPADLVLLAWIQNRLGLSIAATYGHDMGDHTERATELLIIQRRPQLVPVARKAVIAATTKAATKLILKHFYVPEAPS
jgi:EcsC protein family